MTCGQYLAPMLARSVGRLQNPDDTSQCRFCAVTKADQLLSDSRIYWHDRWRNYGIFWAFIAFNIFMAAALYYVFRVQKLSLSSLPSFSWPWGKGKKKKEGGQQQQQEQQGAQP
ncbi:hypothetical protein CDD82_6743 [Ophiocordyceps australis]|uniref:CDR ABC transporter domain-containing protein n=1 Tax=Ophiocordyceps australis TaxID=1399860 RepID=A0A2C5ZJM3_9HYPO|nr:hypothetical protein CDD82_6743 [Ophiocordyceps australis]